MDFKNMIRKIISSSLVVSVFTLPALAEAEVTKTYNYKKTTVVTEEPVTQTKQSNEERETNISESQDMNSPNPSAKVMTYKYKRTTTIEDPQGSETVDTRKISDSEIYNELDYKVDHIPNLDDDLSFNVDAGRVTLMGDLDSSLEQDLAISTASNVDGVRIIVDRTEVK